MKTLIINAHPDYDSINSYSKNLSNYFFTRYKEFSDISDIMTIDLYNMEIPTLDKDMLTIFNKSANKEDLNDHELNISKKMKGILMQFKEAKRIVIVMPLHNFNIPSKLKDYMDNILIPSETFKYTENGSVGLMSDGRKVLLIQSSGSIYTNNDRYTPVEYSNYYLKSMFVEFMGFDKFDIVRAQGTALKDANKETILKEAYSEIDNIIEQFASR